MTSKLTFKPRPSTGWVWVGVIGLALLATSLGLVISLGFSGPFIITILLPGVIGIAFLSIAVFFPTMRYEIDGTKLTLSYVPLLRYTINIEEIKSIRRRDLGVSIVSSIRFPGLALFSVPCPEIGSVKMCATSASNGILIIEAGSKKYGLTPDDEEALVTELKKRMGK